MPLANAKRQAAMDEDLYWELSSHFAQIAPSFGESKKIKDFLGKLAKRDLRESLATRLKDLTANLRKEDVCVADRAYTDFGFVARLDCGSVFLSSGRRRT